ncbi:MAG: ribonuclease III [Aquiluna sp.]|nr:ribonuclease III [Aquiluna sp.]MCF8545296.1 ribonuclease III [Aquiluna sp.]
MSTEALVTELGGTISKELLELALTHSSHAYENGGSNNERLEFLGDSILGYLVAGYVFQENPDLNEGELTKLKNAVVSAQALASAANRINLGSYLKLGKGEEQTSGRNKVNLLADAFEALIGAAYLTAGIDSAAQIIKRHIFPLLKDPDAIREASDPKTSLIELAARNSLGSIRYEVSGTGPDHEMVYTANCFAAERLLSSGIGTSKRAAETQAAIEALRLLANA